MLEDLKKLRRRRQFESALWSRTLALSGELMSSHHPIILTVKEVSQLLRIHRPKVYDLIKSGTLEGFKLGSDWRVKRDSVEKLIGPIPAGFFKSSSQDEEDEVEESPQLMKRIA